MGHVSAQRIDELPVEGEEYVITNAFNCFAFSGVALFVMISGALTLRQDKEISIKELMLHKTLRFFMLYYIWKAIYQVIFMFETGKAFTFSNVKEELLYVLALGRGYYHLWFLPMIAIVYMAVPVIRKGIADRNVCRYFLCIFFATAFFFPALTQCEFKLGKFFAYFLASNDFSLFGGYLGYFILGHYFHQWGNSISNKGKRLFYIVGVGAFVLACVLGTLASRRLGKPSYIMNTPFAVTTFFTVAAIYVAVQLVGKKRECSECVGKALHFGADRVLGIYLLHPLVIGLFHMAGFDTAVCSPILSIPFITMMVFAASALFSLILSKIPGIGRLV
ncbi:MAG: acyltransferase [Roseburia sp.]|nr:acyltransferase [Roseburia sp.]